MAEHMLHNSEGDDVAQAAPLPRYHWNVAAVPRQVIVDPLNPYALLFLKKRAQDRVKHAAFSTSCVGTV